MWMVVPGGKMQKVEWPLLLVIIGEQLQRHGGYNIDGSDWPNSVTQTLVNG